MTDSVDIFLGGMCVCVCVCKMALVDVKVDLNVSVVHGTRMSNGTKD